MTYSLLAGSQSKHLSELMLAVNISELNGKTRIRIYLEAIPKPGLLNRHAGYALSLALLQGFCSFKTYLKHQDAITNSGRTLPFKPV
jgi:hypothetical protein